MGIKRALNTSGSKKGIKAAKSAMLTEKKARHNPPKAKKKVEVISSHLSYDGPLFRVFTDEIRENGRVSSRDVIRHNGSVVILALDTTKSKSDPLVVLERQYRHAAKEYLVELPAGKIEEGEDRLKAAKRELLEETGFRAKRWRKLVRYFASPGFLGEWMQIFVAEELRSGSANPDYDEQIDVELLRLSEVLRRIERGEIHDGKTLISVMLYDRLRRRRGETSLPSRK